MPASDWVTPAQAQAVTKLELSEAELDAAYDDVTDYIRWVPDPTLHFTDPSDYHHIRARSVLKRAIAWQAAYRQVVDPLTVLEDRPLVSESILDYSHSFDASGGAIAVVPGRVRQMLASAGLLRWTGHSRYHTEREDLYDNEVFIRTR